MPLARGSWVQLDGRDADIEDFLELVDPPNVLIEKEEAHGTWWLGGQVLAGVRDVDEAMSVGADVVGTLNGCAKLAHPDHGSVGVGQAARMVTPDGTRSSVAISDAVGPVREARTVAPNPPAGLPRPLKWLRLAGTDGDVTHVLGLLGKLNPTWSELYFVLELIERHIGGSVASKGWATSSEVGLLRRTANNFTAIGAASRHARPDFVPPANPMPLHDAVRLTRRIAEQWLDSLT